MLSWYKEWAGVPDRALFKTHAVLQVSTDGTIYLRSRFEIKMASIYMPFQRLKFVFGLVMVQNVKPFFK